MKRLIVTIISLIAVTAAFTQELRLAVSDKPLNAVLNSLNVEISFNDKALSAYKISVSKVFRTPDEAIRFLLKGKPFKIDKVGNVYVISPTIQYTEAVKISDTAKRTYLLAGKLSDISTGEPLPYAHIQTAQGVTTTNEAGLFSLTLHANLPVRIQAQYIGYEVLDTTLKAGNHELKLATKAFELGKVVVGTSSSTMLMQSGRTSGEVRINPQTARYLPGSVDNSVFNLIRLIPGVRASGEPSEDLIAWGSNIGNGLLTYDGFTIYGMKTFNDQISSVNPYLVKDMRLLKGGYDASMGGRIGAIAEITGNEGSFSSPSVKINVSSYTANIFASAPIAKRASVSAAYRQTFYNLYNQASANPPTEEHDAEGNLSGVYIKPQYDFRDLNLKLAGRASDNDSYHISLYGADDHFKFSATQQSFEVKATEKNRQYGAAGAYNRAWSNGSTSKILLSYSQFSAQIDNVSGIDSSQSVPLQKSYIGSSIIDFALALEHRFNIGERQQVRVGGKWQRYVSELNTSRTQINNPTLYVTNNILLGKLWLQAGLRADMVVSEKIHLQPRLSTRYSITDGLTATASFGLYNQFLTRIPAQYGTGSYQLIWSLSDTTFLLSTQLVAGLAYSKNGWLFSSEGYLKKNRNELYFLNNTIYPVDNTILGADFYVKRQWGENAVFGSYSIVNTAQPQTNTGHEIKTGVVYALRHFYLSGTFVYGTGFPSITTGGHGHGQEDEQAGHGQSHEAGHNDLSRDSDKPYSRLDLSFTYKVQVKKMRLKAGASVLNIFDTNNIKYNYRLADQNNVINVYTKATPFTPVIFFEITF